MHAPGRKTRALDGDDRVRAQNEQLTALPTYNNKNIKQNALYFFIYNKTRKIIMIEQARDATVLWPRPSVTDSNVTCLDQNRRSLSRARPPAGGRGAVADTRG